MEFHKIRLFITRHGITPENKLHILQGQLDTKLDEEGIAQSKCLGIRFADIKFDFIYCSPLIRTMHTIQFAMENMNFKSELILDERLKERGFGSWEGKTKAQRVGPRPHDEETNLSVENRVISFLTNLGASFVGQMVSPQDESKIPLVLLVTHGATFHCIERALSRLGAKISEDKPIYNTAVSEYEILLDKKGVLKSGMNLISRDVSHLEGFEIKWID